MGFFTPQTATVNIDTDNCITVRKLTFGEFSDIMDRHPDMNERKFGFDLVRTAILSWDGQGFEGRPVSAENINALPWEVIAVLVPVVADLNTVSDAVEGKA